MYLPRFPDQKQLSPTDQAQQNKLLSAGMRQNMSPNYGNVGPQQRAQLFANNQQENVRVNLPTQNLMRQRLSDQAMTPASSQVRPSYERQSSGSMYNSFPFQVGDSASLGSLVDNQTARMPYSAKKVSQRLLSQLSASQTNMLVNAQRRSMRTTSAPASDIMQLQQRLHERVQHRQQMEQQEQQQASQRRHFQDKGPLNSQLLSRLTSPVVPQSIQPSLAGGINMTSSNQISGGSRQQIRGGSSQQISGGSSQQISGGSSQEREGFIGILQSPPAARQIGHYVSRLSAPGLTVASMKSRRSSQQPESKSPNSAPALPDAGWAFKFEDGSSHPTTFSQPAPIAMQSSAFASQARKQQQQLPLLNLKAQVSPKRESPDDNQYSTFAFNPRSTVSASATLASASKEKKLSTPVLADASIEQKRGNKEDSVPLVDMEMQDDEALEETAEELELLAEYLKGGDNSVDPWNFLLGSPLNDTAMSGSPMPIDGIKPEDSFSAFLHPRKTAVPSPTSSMKTDSPSTPSSDKSSMETCSNLASPKQMASPIEQFLEVQQRMCDLRPEWKDVIEQINPLRPQGLMAFFDRICVRSPEEQSDHTTKDAASRGAFGMQQSSKIPDIASVDPASHELSILRDSSENLSAARSEQDSATMSVVKAGTVTSELEGSMPLQAEPSKGVSRRRSSAENSSVFPSNVSLPKLLPKLDGQSSPSAVNIISSPCEKISPNPAAQTSLPVVNSVQKRDSAPSKIRPSKKSNFRNKKLYYQNKEFYEIRKYLRDLTVLQNEICRKEKLLKSGKLFYNQLTRNSEPGDFVFRSVEPSVQKKKIDNKSLTNRKVVVLDDVPDEEITQYSDTSATPFQYFGSDSQTCVSETLMKILSHPPKQRTVSIDGDNEVFLPDSRTEMDSTCVS